MRTNRIEGLTDGIFAIVMTVLILDIRLPAFAGPDLAGQVLRALHELVPHFITFFLSFILLGILWIGHHNQMNFIHKSDRVFLWLNILFYLFVCLVPFSASLLGAAPNTQPGVIFYATNLALCSFVLLILWQYAVRFQLVNENVTPELARKASQRILLGLLWYGLAIGCALVPGAVGIQLSHLCFIIPIVLFILPGSVDALWKRL